MKISVVSQNGTYIDNIRQILQGGAGAHQVHLFDGGVAQLGAMADQIRPDLVILDKLCCDMSGISALDHLGQRHPSIAFIMLCDNLPTELVIQAMRIGVRDVLPSPVEPGVLQAAVIRIEQKMASSTEPHHKGKVLAFLACKGGSGATFLAANLGYVLAAEHGKRVALIDLNLQLGDASLFVSDEMPKYTVADVSSNISRLDASFLDSSMVHVLPNFAVLAAPERPDQAGEVKAEHIEVLMRLAKDVYDYVILDMDRSINGLSIKALDHTDLIFPVLQDILPFIRDTKRILVTLLTLGYARDKFRPLLNRFEKGGDIQLKDIEHVLGMKMYRTIPNSYKAVSASVNQGIPVAKIAPHDSVTKALQEIARDLDGTKRPEKSGLLSHLFGHGRGR